MKNKFLALVMVIAMALTMIPGVAMADSTDSCTEPCTHEAAVGSIHYDTLEEAVAAAKSKTGNVTIELLKDCTIEKYIDFQVNGLNPTIDGGSEKYRISPSASFSGAGLIYLGSNVSSNLCIKNVTFEDINNPNIVITIGQSKDASLTQKITVEDCVIKNNTLKHIASMESNNTNGTIEFIGCTIENNTSADANYPYLFYTSSGFKGPFTLDKNQFKGNNSDLIYVKSNSADEKFTLKDNTFECEEGFNDIIIGGTATVSGNTFTDEVDITVTGSGDATFSGTINGNLSISAGGSVKGDATITGDVSVQVKEGDDKEDILADTISVEGKTTYHKRLASIDNDKYGVIFNYNGGIDAEGFSSIQIQVTKNSKIDKSAAPIATLNGSTFDGWYKEAGCTNAWDFDTDEVGAATTLYAKWTDEAPAPAPNPASSGSGIKVKYEGGNSFSTSKSAVPTSVEIDGVAVPFTGNGSSFTVNSIPAGAKWVTVRWNSTSVTTNFTPSGAYAAEIEIPKTGDASFWAAVAAVLGF